MPTSAHGGKVITGGAASFHVTTWRVQKRARLAESTDSGTSGLERWNSIVTGALITLEFVWDTDVIPDVDAALEPGGTTTLVTWFGALGAAKTYSFAAIIVETCEIVNDNVNDVIRGTVTALSNGTITDPPT